MKDKVKKIVENVNKSKDLDYEYIKILDELKDLFEAAIAELKIPKGRIRVDTVRYPNRLLIITEDAFYNVYPTVSKEITYDLKIRFNNVIENYKYNLSDIELISHILKTV